MSHYLKEPPPTARRIAPLSPSDPRVIAQYRLLGVLGRGGMGRVYLGQSPMGKRVAIKVIREELAEDPVFRRRFAREVAIARTVSALYTAPVVAADPDGDQPWFATAYIEGPSVESLVSQHGPLAPQTVLILAAGLAEALAGLHATGFAHRDLKPANVLLTDVGPYVIDFGIALPENATRLTSGVILGTPGFMAPERIEGARGNTASDIFSFGATLVFASTGHGIVTGDNLAAQLVQMTRGRFDLTGVPSGLRPLVIRCLARNPKDRPTATEIARMLVGSGVVAPGPGWFGAAWPIDTDVGGAARLGRRVDRRLVLGGLTTAAVLAGGAAWAVTHGFRFAAGDRAPSPVSRRGMVLWQTNVEGGSLVHAGHDLVLTSNMRRGTVAVNPVSGVVMWSDRDAMPEALLFDELVLLSGPGGYQVVSLLDGERLFTMPLPGRPQGNITTTSGFVVAGVGDTLYFVHRSGQRNWPWKPRPAVGMITSGLAGDDRLLLRAESVGGTGRRELRLTLLNPWTHTVVWRSTHDALAGFSSVSLRLTEFLALAIGTVEEGIVALRLADGQLAWTRPGPDDVSGLAEQAFSPMVGATHIVLREAGDLVGVPLDGRQPWRKRFDADAAVAAMSPTGNEFYVVATSKIHAFDVASGDLRWRIDLPRTVLNRRPVSMRVDPVAAYVEFERDDPDQAMMRRDLFAFALS